jgi:hypothetical protein
MIEPNRQAGGEGSSVIDKSGGATSSLAVSKQRDEDWHFLQDSAVPSNRLVLVWSMPMTRGEDATLLGQSPYRFPQVSAWSGVQVSTPVTIAGGRVFPAPTSTRDFTAV